MHRWLAVTAATLGVLALAAGEPYPSGNPSPSRDVTFVTAVDVARSIREGRADLSVVDVRADSSFDAYHIPGAEQIALDELAARDWPPTQRVIVYATDDAEATRAAVTLKRRGVANAQVLRGGLLSWVSEIAEPRLAPLPASASPAERAARREQLDLSRYFGGTPFVSPSVAPPRVPQQSEAGAVARILRRGC